MTKIKKMLVALTAICLSASMLVSVTATMNKTAYAEELEATKTSTVNELEGVDIDVAVPTEVGVVANYGIATIDDTTDDDVDYGTLYFDGGSGTATDPFKISTADQFMNIGYLSNAMISNFYYFSLDSDITLSGSGYICTYFQGEIDGYVSRRGNHTIEITSGSLWLSAYTVGEANYVNLNINENGGFFSFVAYSGAYITGATDSDGAYIYDNYVTFDNITVSGSYSVSTNAAPLTAITYGTTTFEDCTNNATISITGYAGIFLGGYPIHAKVSYINCENTAEVYGVCVGFFNGNSFNEYSSFVLTTDSSFSNVSTDTYSAAYVYNCSNSGTIKGTTSCSAFATNTATGTSYNAAANEAVTAYFTAGNMGIAENYLKYFSSSYYDTTVTFTDNSGDATDVTVSDIDSYQLLITVSTQIWDAAGNLIGTGYVRLGFTSTTLAGLNENAPYITSIIGNKEWDTESLKYEDIAGTEGYPILTDHLGHEYIIVGTTAVVDSSSMVNLIAGAYDEGVDAVTCSTSSPEYALTGYKGEVVLGTYTISASEIPYVVPSTSTNE